MGKWILGVLGTVIAGLLLAYATNFLNLNSGKDTGGGRAIAATGGSGTGGSGNAGSGAGEGPPPPVVMGALEIGTNRQGHDFDDIGKPAGNAEVCAEMCRNEKSCDAMTFVKSTGRCWLKSGVPAASADADMISAVKVEAAK